MRLIPCAVALSVDVRCGVTYFASCSLAGLIWSACLPFLLSLDLQLNSTSSAKLSFVGACWESFSGASDEVLSVGLPAAKAVGLKGAVVGLRNEKGP